MADAKQPPTETDSETVVMSAGDLGAKVDVKVVPTRLGMYEIKTSVGVLPKDLAGKYTDFMLAKQAINTYYAEEVRKSKDLDSFIDPKLKEQLKKRKEERSAKSTSR